MKDTQTQDMTSLKQPILSWPEAQTNILKATERDAEPFSKAPAPSAFHSSEITSRFTPEPLLAITPEKTPLYTERNNNSRPFERGDGDRKGKQRVRFAPGTRTSPPSKNTSAETEKKAPVVSEGDGKTQNEGSFTTDDESLPRSYLAIRNKIYQPGRYADRDGDKDSKKPASSVLKPSTSSSALKRYTVETQGGKTVYVPMDRTAKNIMSEYSELGQDTHLSAKIVCHKPAKMYDFDDEVCNTELKEVFDSASRTTPTPRTPPRSRSASPLHRHSSPNRKGRKSPSSPSRHVSSPCRSPGRLTPVEGIEFFTPDKASDPVVHVIREAPYQPKFKDYVFPFQDGGEQEEGEGGRVYDCGVENTLGRPEFNSALKIGEELKSVKGRRPDTWGAVSQKLKTCNRQRTQIQEKASSRVNIQMQSGLFSDLVDVDVPLDDLCHDLEQGISLRAPTPRLPGVKVPVGKEPDLMEFFSPDLQQELPDLTLIGIQPIGESLTTADPILAFDLYRHNRAWNGLTDS